MKRKWHDEKAQGCDDPYDEEEGLHPFGMRKNCSHTNQEENGVEHTCNHQRCDPNVEEGIAFLATIGDNFGGSMPRVI